MSGLLQHQNQEMVWVMNFNENFERPKSSIGHPGMDAPFGVYPTSRWLGDDRHEPLQQARRRARQAGAARLMTTPTPFSTSATRFGKRSPTETRKWTTKDLLEAMLAVDIWCGEVKRHLDVDRRSAGQAYGRRHVL